MKTMYKRNLEHFMKFLGLIIIILTGYITNIGSGYIERTVPKVINKSIYVIKRVSNIDDRSPLVESTCPSINDQEVSPLLNEILVTFDEPMKNDSYSLIDCGGIAPNLTGFPKFIDNKTIRIPVNLEPETEYQICFNSNQSIRSNFVDLSGNSARRYELKFKTDKFDSVALKQEKSKNIKSKDKAIDDSILGQLKVMCNNTVDLINKNGIEVTKKMVLENTNQFVKNDSYVFIINLDGIMIAHPLSPGLNENNIIDVRDKNGNRFIYNIIQTAKNKGSGVIDYFWPRPDHNIPVKKSTYFQKVSDSDYIVCAGVYRDNELL